MKKTIIAISICVLLSIVFSASCAFSEAWLDEYIVDYLEEGFSDFGDCQCELSEQKTCAVLTLKVDFNMSALMEAEQETWDTIRNGFVDQTETTYEFIQEVGSDLNFVLNVMDTDGVLVVSAMNGDMLYSVR